MASDAVEVLDVPSASALLSHDYAHFLSVAFFFYDHSITFGDEVNYIWNRPKSQSSYWFIANRYLAFFGNIAVTVVINWPLSEQRYPSTMNHWFCRKYTWFRQIHLVINQILACVLLTIRTYALYGRSRRVLIFMLTSGAILISVAAWSLTGQSTGDNTPHRGCNIALTKATDIRIAASWEALFAYDSMILVLTLLKTYKGSDSIGPLFSTSVPLVRLVIRDGAVYFAIMAIANLANILTFYMATPYMRGGLSAFSSCISVTMVSRLLLNLHRSTNQGVFTTYAPEETDTFTNTSMLFTSRFTGGTGATSATDDFEMMDVSLVDSKAPMNLPMHTLPF